MGNISIKRKNLERRNNNRVKFTATGIGTAIISASVNSEYKNGAADGIAIEPMVNMGDKRVEFLSDGWTCKAKDDLPSAHYENTVLITENGVEILTL